MRTTAGQNPTQAAVLNWQVFVTPGIPIVTLDRPPGIREAYSQAMAATLIYGKNDAVLVDAFMTVKQASALADWVAAKNKNLTTIYIAHGHGDHWFGVGTLLDRFPNARAVATPNTVEVMRQNTSPDFLAIWKVAFPGQIPGQLLIAEELQGEVNVVVGGIASNHQSDRTSVISTGWRKRREQSKNSTTRCWSCIRTGSIPGGPSGVRYAQPSHRMELWPQLSRLAFDGQSPGEVK